MCHDTVHCPKQNGFVFYPNECCKCEGCPPVIESEIENVYTFKATESEYNLLMECYNDILRKMKEKTICGLCKFSESIPHEDDVYCSMFKCNKEWKNTCEKFEEY